MCLHSLQITLTQRRVIITPTDFYMTLKRISYSVYFPETYITLNLFGYFVLKECHS